MNTVATIRGAFVACALGAALVTAAPHGTATPTYPVGHCLFGHVNPNPNSACRGSDSANWPHAPADPNGHPLKECMPGNDGEAVSTEDVHGGRHWFICGHETNITGEELWEWKEVLLGRSR